MPLIDCENNLILIWSANCVISSGNIANQVGTIAITDTLRYSKMQKCLNKLKSGFTITINWNKYQFKVITQTQN